MNVLHVSTPSYEDVTTLDILYTMEKLNYN
jgi:hypothetical protein